MYVSFPGGITHFVVDIHYNRHEMYISCYRNLPFIEHKPLDESAIPCARRGRDIVFKDLVTQSIMETYPVLGDIVGTVLMVHSTGTLSHIEDWKIRWHPSGGNSIMVDTKTWQHVRMDNLISTRNVGKHTKRFFDTNFMGYVFTDVDVLKKVHEKVSSLPDKYVSTVVRTMIDNCPDDIVVRDTNAYKTVGIVEKRVSVVDEFNKHTQIIPEWAMVPIANYDAMVKMVNDSKIFYDSVDRILKMKMEQCQADEQAFEYPEGIVLMSDFSYKVPYESFSKEQGQVVKSTSMYVYVSTGVSRRSMREYLDEVSRVEFPYDSTKHYTMVREFMDSVNTLLMYLSVLGSLYVIRDVCDKGNTPEISSDRTHIVDQYAIELMVNSKKRVVRSSFSGHPGIPTVVSGMMSSGKTSFLLSVGLCQVIFQFGCPNIPAGVGSELYVHGGISVIKNHNDDMFRSRSTFQSHLLCISNALHGRDKPLLILDEPFSSTRFADARRLLSGVINLFCTKRRDGIILISSHLEISADDDVRYLEVRDYHVNKTSRRDMSSTIGEWSRKVGKCSGKFVEYCKDVKI